MHEFRYGTMNKRGIIDRMEYRMIRSGSSDITNDEALGFHTKHALFRNGALQWRRARELTRDFEEIPSEEAVPMR